MDVVVVVDLGLDAADGGLLVAWARREELVGAGRFLLLDLPENAHGCRGGTTAEPVACCRFSPDAALSRRHGRALLAEHGVRGLDASDVEVTEALLPVAVVMEDADAEDSVRRCGRWPPNAGLCVLMEDGWAAELLLASLDIAFSFA